MHIMTMYKESKEKPWELMCCKYSLETLQKLLEGYIEEIHLPFDAIALVNEEAKLKDMPFNTKMMTHNIYGPIIIVGINKNKDDYDDVPEIYIEQLEGRYDE